MPTSRPRPILRGLLPLSLGLAVGLVGAGCQRPEAGVHVTIESPLAVGADVDRVTAVATLFPDGVDLGVQVFEAPELAGFPLTVNFVSGKAVVEGSRIGVEVTGEKANRVVASAFGEAVLTAKEGAALTVSLEKIPEQRFDAGVGDERACDNGLDDDADGRADCADPDCDGKSCLQGGFVCGSAACSCAGGVRPGVYQRQTFAARSDPSVHRISEGPLRGFAVVAGGRLGDGGLSPAVELYSLDRGTLTARSLGEARLFASVVSFPDGGVAVLGGVRADGGSTTTLELLGSAGAFSPVALAGTPRLVSAHAEASGPAILVGGDVVGTAALRVGLAGSVSSLPTLPSVRTASAPTGNGGRLLAGGGAAVDVLLPDGGLLAGPTLPSSFDRPAVAPLPRGKVLVAGGISAAAPSARAFILEPNAAGYAAREIAPLQIPKRRPRAAALGNGWIYVEEHPDENPSAPEWFDPATERFQLAAPPPVARVGHAPVGLDDRHVLLAGGTRDGGISAYPDADGYTVTLSCP